MKISFNWLKSILPLEQTPEAIEALLTATGLEVEHYEYTDSVKGGMRGLIVGEVTACEKHPNADKLSLCKVDVGTGELLSIVCGAPNVAKDLKVIVAPVGTTIYPSEGKPFTIQKAKIRGEQSMGMLCAEDEIGLGKGHDGLLLLPQEAVIGSLVSELFKVESDVVFEIGLTANRGDAASHLGVAREIATVLNLPLKIDFPAFPTEDKSQNITIKVEDASACPRYSGVVLNQIQVADSPAWLKNRLLSIGLKPINNVIDVTNYILHAYGQPLHAFDFKAVQGGIINVRQAKEGETLTTLDGIERKLNAGDLIIADENKPMCLAGVYGGLNSGVQLETKTIFLESAYFSPDKVRRTAKRHSLNTDSSFRFERGCDPEMCIPALQVAVSLLSELAGAKLVSAVYDVYPQPLLPFKVTLRKAMVEKIIGIEIPDAKTEEILKGLGIQIVSKDEAAYHLEVPQYKSDVTREIDVIEELIRIYGFKHIPLQTSLSMSLNYHGKQSARQAELKISEILSANSFREMMNNSLTADKFYPEKDNLVYLSNPLSNELNVMRGSMLFGALETIAYNKNRKQSNCRFFEFGRIYQQKEKGFKETEQLIIVASGNKTNESWEQKAMAVDSAYLQSICNKVMDAFKTRVPYTVESVDASILQDFGIKEPVLYVSFDWSKLLKSAKAFELKAIPQFPIVRRDLSLVLDKSVRFEAVQQIIEKQGGKKVKACNVFDVYAGKPLEETQKALGVSVDLYDPEKTMSDADIDPLMDKLIQTFETELNAIIRKS